LHPEHNFNPDRNFRFDFAHIETKTAIEIEGGTRHKSRHTSYEGFAEDCVKYNGAIFLGWDVFRLTGEMIQPDAIEEIAAFIRQKMA